VALEGRLRGAPPRQLDAPARGSAGSPRRPAIEGLGEPHEEKETRHEGEQGDERLFDRQATVLGVGGGVMGRSTASRYHAGRDPANGVRAL
jgi:hypothetical protein